MASHSCLIAATIAACLAGCAATPSHDPPPEFVRIAGQASAPKARAPAASLDPGPLTVKTEGNLVSSSLVRTTVTSGAGTVQSTFVTSELAKAPEVTRLESSWTRQLEGASELRVGDAISVPGASGNPVRFAGVQLGTGARLREDVVTGSRMATRGVAVLPSTLDALLTSAGSSRTALGPQGVRLDGKVNITGANTVSFATRDALGRRVTVTQPLLAKTRLTGRGCTDYSIDLGKVREDFVLESNRYGDWFANTRMLCGIPLGITVEGFGEYLDSQGGSVGLGLAKRLSALGTASVGMASSADTDTTGWLARFGFEHSNALFDLNLKTNVQSAGFRRVGALVAEDPAARRTVASLGMKTGTAGDIALVYAAETTYSNANASLLALSQRVRFDEHNTLSMTAGHSLVGREDVSVYLMFRRAFGAYRARNLDIPDMLDIIRPTRTMN